MALRRVAVIAASLAAATVIAASGSAFAQPQPPPPAQPKPKPTAPPGTKTDMEIDPDAKPPPPPELPPVQPGQWGVGGKEEEGKFAPPSNKKEDEERAKQKAEEDKKPVDLGPARRVSFDTVVGFGGFHDPTNDGSGETGRTKTTNASFVFGFSWRVADIWTIGARYGLVRANDSGPGGPFNNVAAGNLELYVSPSFQLSRELRLPAQVGVFFPTAQGDWFPDVADPNRNVLVRVAQANLAAAHSRGWEDMPLFASKRLGIRLGGGVTWDHGSMHVTGGTKIDLMLKTGGGEPPTGFNYKSPNYAWVTEGSFHWRFFDGKLEPGLRAWFVLGSLPVAATGRDYSGPQFVFEPQVNGRFTFGAEKGMALVAGVGFIAPVAPGMVGAGSPYDGSIKGLRINAAFEF